MLKEFKEFAIRGNVMDLAVAVVLGAAFGKIVTSFVNDILMPPIGRVVGKVDFSNLFVDLSGLHHATLAEAKAAGAATINVGMFVNTVLDFVFVAFAVFILVRYLNKLKTKPEPAAVTKECPYCFSSVHLQATKCPNCTSALLLKAG